MVVLSNHRLGPTVELLLSREVAVELVCEVAAEAKPVAEARWEHELVRWLERWATATSPTLDVTDIAWTPASFERQRRFLLDAIERATARSVHTRALRRWAEMVEAHPRDSVQVGRRWQWPADQATV